MKTHIVFNVCRFETNVKIAETFFFFFFFLMSDGDSEQVM